MADDKIKIQVIIDAAKSAKDLTSVNKSLEDMKEALNSVNKESEEYNALQKQIAESTEKANKASTEQALAQAKSAKSVGDMKKALRELKSQIAQVAEGSKEFQALSAAAGDLADRIGDTADATKAFAGTGVERLKNSFGLLTESFANFDVGKLKTALSGLAGAMKTIPIFLIIEGVKYLIENFDKLSKGSGLLAKVLRGIGDVVTWVSDKITEFLDLIGVTNSELDKMGEAIKTSAEKGKDALDQQTKAIDRQIAVAKAAGKKTVDLEKAKQKAIIDTNLVIANQIKAFVAAGGQLDEEKRKQLSAALEAIKDAKVQEKIIDIEAEKEKDAKAKEAGKKAADERKKKLEEEQKYLDDLKKLRIDNIQDERAKAMAQFEEEIANIKAQGETKNQIRAEIEKKYQKILDDIDQKRADEEQKKKEESQKEADDLFKQLSDEQDKETQRVKEEKDKQQKLEEEAEKQKVQLATDGVNSIQALDDAVFAVKMNNLKQGTTEYDKAAKKQFNINKGVQLGLAVIDGYKAITASLAQAPIAIGPLPNPAGIASLAFAAITSAANIAKIASSKFQSTASASGGGPSTPNIGSASAQSTGGGQGSSLLPPQLRRVGGGLPQMAGTNSSEIGPGAPQPVKAYVVTGDISNAQDKASIIKRRTSF